MPNSAKKSLINSNEIEESSELRRGPWTLEEDTLLTHYIARNGEGRWNMVARFAGLKRTGKSCRLRWLNYLKPDIKRGNLTPQEQLLILELHTKWGNRWSKIAQHLPGRTDNEIKNYWRTRVQKQARQLNIESNSEKFFDAVRSFWMPRLLEKVEQNSSASSSSAWTPPLRGTKLSRFIDNSTTASGSVFQPKSEYSNNDNYNYSMQPINNFPPEDSDLINMDCSISMPDFMTIPQLMDLSDDQSTTSSAVYFNGAGCSGGGGGGGQCVMNDQEQHYGYYHHHYYYDMASMGNFDILPSECHVADGDWAYDQDATQDPMWNMDDIWQFRD